MRQGRKISHIIDHINGIAAALASAILIFIMLIVSIEVAMSSIWDRPIAWVTEISEYGLLFVAFLSAAWVLQKERHVVMNLVINQLKPGTQVLTNLVTSIMAAAMCLVTLWYSAQSTWIYFQEGTFRPSILEIHDGYIMTIIPIGCLLLFIQFLRRIYGYWLLWKAQTPRIDEGLKMADMRGEN